MKKWIWISMIVAAVGLAGCGSGSSDKAAMPAPAPSTDSAKKAPDAATAPKTGDVAKADEASPATSTATEPTKEPGKEKEEASNTPEKKAVTTEVNGKKVPTAPRPDPVGPDASKAKTPAVRVAPSGNYKDFVGTYELDDPLFRKINSELKAKGKTPFRGEIEIKSDGTYRFDFGTKGLVTTTGTVVAKDRVIELHPLLANGKAEMTDTEKIVLNLRLQPDNKSLQMMFIPKGKTTGAIRTFVKK